MRKPGYNGQAWSFYCGNWSCSYASRVTNI